MTSNFRPGMQWYSGGHPPEYFIHGAAAFPVTNARTPTPREARRHRLERIAVDRFIRLCEASGWTGSAVWHFPDGFPEAWDGSMALDFLPPDGGAASPSPCDGIGLFWSAPRGLEVVLPDGAAEDGAPVSPVRIDTGAFDRFTRLCEASGWTGSVLWWLPAGFPARWDGVMSLEFLPQQAGTAPTSTADAPVHHANGALGLVDRLRRLGLRR